MDADELKLIAALIGGVFLGTFLMVCLVGYVLGLSMSATLPSEESKEN